MDFFLSQSFHIITKKKKIFFHSPLHQLPIESIKFHADAVRCVSVCVSESNVHRRFKCVT